MFIELPHKERGADMTEKPLRIQVIPAISAIYFALLQTGYDYYRLGKTDDLIDQLSAFQSARQGYPFFRSVKQTTCEVYPYWPRAAILETATFYIDLANDRFHDLNKFKAVVMSANNLREDERDEALWNWIAAFPTALKRISLDKGFQDYLKWEQNWAAQQNHIYAEELRALQKRLRLCAERYGSPIIGVRIVLDPIKCAYSSDHHFFENELIVCSGTFDAESVIHESIHPIVHNIITDHQETILGYDLSDLGVDRSYYLTGDAAGRLNAFEEYFVRALTAEISADTPPKNLPAFLEQTLSALRK